MSLHQLFCNNPSIETEQDSPFCLNFDAQDLSHIKALRLHVGEHIAVIDASSDYFEVEITHIENSEVWVKISQHLDKPQKTLPVNLVQGFAKGEKMDTVLRAATELGIDSFYPCSMHRSVVKLDQKKGSKRIGRFATIARNAAMQSGRTSIPSIEPIQSLENLAATWTSADEIFLFWEEASQKQTIASAFQSLIETKRLQSVQQIWVIVGPEGGISPDEVALIKQSRANVHQLSLGPSILRTETAGIVATALVINELRRVSGWAD